MGRLWRCKEGFCYGKSQQAYWQHYQNALLPIKRQKSINVSFLVWQKKKNTWGHSWRFSRQNFWGPRTASKQNFKICNFLSTISIIYPEFRNRCQNPNADKILDLLPIRNCQISQATRRHEALFWATTWLKKAGLLAKEERNEQDRSKIRPSKKTRKRDQKTTAADNWCWLYTNLPTLARIRFWKVLTKGDTIKNR